MKKILPLLLVVSLAKNFCQAETVDPFFNPQRIVGVNKVLIQPDGKLLIGHQNGIVRLRLDGSIDSSFNPGGTGPTGSSYGEPLGRIYGIAPCNDGKYLIVGNFSAYNGSARPGFARLLSDGALDHGFVPDSDSAIAIGSIIELPDLSVIGVGNSWESTLSLIRYNSNGGTPLFVTNGFVAPLILQSSDRIICSLPGRGGETGFDFLSTQLVRRQLDGSLDSSFNSPGFYNIHRAEMHPSGKILVLATTFGEPPFCHWCGPTHLYRLFSDGTMDNTFTPIGGIASFAVKPNGKVVVLGPEAPNGAERMNIWQLNEDGTRDLSFTSPVDGILTGSEDGYAVYYYGDSLALSPAGDIHAVYASRYLGSGFIRLVPDFSPIITQTPQSTTTNLGTTASFSVAAVGTGPMSYQWLFNGAPLVGQTGTSLTVSQIAVTNAGIYSVMVSNSIGTTASLPAALTVALSLNVSRMNVPATANIFGAGHSIPPSPAGDGGGILPPHIDFTANSGMTFSFSANGLVSPDILINPAGTLNGPDGGPAFAPCGITSFGGISGISADTTIFLAGVFLDDSEPADPAPTPFDFTTGNLGTSFTNLSPAIGQTFFIGDGLTQTGSGEVQTFIPPPTATRLFLGFADGFDGGHIAGPPGYYFDNDGILAVNVARLTSNSPPVVMRTPESLTNSITDSTSAIFNVAATGTSITYQWQFNGTNLVGETNSSLSLTNLHRTDSGIYSVIVSNSYGSVTNDASLTVRVPERLLSPQLQPDGHFRLLFGDSDGGPLSLANAANFEVQISTNLTDWSPLPGTLSVTNGLLLLDDQESSAEQRRFYRVVEH